MTSNGRGDGPVPGHSDTSDRRASGGPKYRNLETRLSLGDPRLRRDDISKQVYLSPLL